MRHLRAKLLAAMLAIVVVTVVVSALFTRRVTHEEIRRLKFVSRQAINLTPLEHAMATDRNFGAAFAAMHARGIVVDAARHIIGTSDDLRGAQITIGENVVRISQDRHMFEFHLPAEALHVGNTIAGYAYVFPAEERQQRDELNAFDRRLIVPFAAATVAAILLALFMARRVTLPVERLTAATREMARGGTPPPVKVRGRDEIAELARSFNEMAAALARQQELRRRMVSDIAHELRTPLTNFRCELESIEDGLAAVDPPRIASMAAEIANLTRLVDDLQELAVADAGGLRLDVERTRVDEVLTRVADTFRAEAQRRSMTLEVHAEPVELDADARRIAQVIRNLLTNAFQHTPDCGSIAARVWRDGETARISVADSGSGIPEEDLDRIFERFYRVDASRSRNSGGAGLGLAIVRQLVELHGGSVRAENSPSRGATFTIALPLHHTFTSRH